MSDTRFNSAKRRGFTLLELSIVLVIISLIIGGIILSRSLIRQAKIHGVLVEYNQYLQAIQEFQDKYQALPGDMLNATGVWGALATCPNVTVGTAGQIATCNGNGDGRIGSSNNTGALTDKNEWWLAWQHLSNAKLIDGNYSGGGVATATPGINVPTSKLTPGAWTLLYYINSPNAYGHILAFGAVNGVSLYTTGGALTSNEAQGLDLKIDDGIATSGIVHNSGDTAWPADTGQLCCGLFFVLGL